MKNANENLFDNIFQKTFAHVSKLFNESVVSFTVIGPKIDLDAASEYINNIIDDINKKPDDDINYDDMLKLSVSYLVLSFIYKFEEENFFDEEPND